MFQKRKDEIVVTVGPVELKVSRQAVTLNLGRVPSFGPSRVMMPIVSVWVQRNHGCSGWLPLSVDRFYVGYVGAIHVNPLCTAGIIIHKLKEGYAHG